MKVAIAVSTFPPYHGGMGAVAETQARLLAASGHEVTVLTAGDPRHSSVGEYRVVRLRRLVRIGNGSVLPGLVSALSGFDAVILHYPAFGLIEPTLLWRYLHRRQAAFYVYYHMDPLASGVRGAIFMIYERVFLRKLFDLADAVAVSSLDYALAGRIGGLPDRFRRKLVEIPLAVDTEAFHPAPLGTGEYGRYGLAEKNLLFVGGMDKAHDFKGVPTLLAAFADAAVPNLRLHLVGDGELKGAYEREAERLHLTDPVIFHGRLDDDDLRRLYRAVDVLVLPSVSRSEAFGLVILEAAASGRPAIASRLPGVRTLIKEGETGWLVTPNDEAGLSRAIREAFSDPARIRIMGGRAREQVVANWGMERLRQGLERLLQI